MGVSVHEGGLLSLATAPLTSCSGHTVISVAYPAGKSSKMSSLGSEPGSVLSQ